LPNGPQKEILAGGYHGRYLASGHVVYMHAGTLFAMPFDLSRLEARGPSVPTVEAVLANPGTAAAQFTISRSGTLAYIEGAGQEGDAPIVWLDSAGKVAPLRKERANWGNIQFAPDGRRLAVDIRAPQGDIFVYEWDRDTLSQLTFDAASDTNPVWSPDGSFIAFASTRGTGGTANLYLQRSDGTGDAMRLIDAGSASRGLTDFVSASRFPTSWHPSGKFLAYSETRPTTGLDVMILPLERDSASGWKPGKPVTFLSGPANEFDALFSPDGRWIAYTSSESGRFELFVRPFPGPGGKWKVSADVGARFAAWSRSTPELLFMAPGGTRLMSAAYSVEGDSFHAEKPRVWAEGRFARPAAQRGFDIHPDGKRIATVAGPEPQAVTRQERAVFVFNFFDELRRIAPTTKR